MRKEITDSRLRPYIGPLGWLLAFVLLASAIFIEALHGPTIDNSIIPNLDKMAHVAAFGLPAFLLLRYLRAIGFSSGWRILPGVGLIITIMGVLDEWLQSSVPGRRPAPWMCWPMSPVQASLCLCVFCGQRKRR